MENEFKKLAEFTGHEYNILTPRGNAAILIALGIAKQLGKTKVYTPDQGGWFSFKTYPRILGMELELLKTNDGIIEELNLNENSALIYAQPAGYFAAQNMKEIYNKCKNKTFVIADVSGSIGDKDICNGEFADIMIGSFSEWKPINIGYGGFISFKDKKYLEAGKDILTISKTSPNLEKELEDKLKTISERYKRFYNLAKTIKKDLSKYGILHTNKKGINVIVAFDSEKEKKEIIEYCNKQKLEHTLCPRYIRVNKPAISIEVKRL